MNEGVENDDVFRMVEDEFLAIAQQFTVHLHAAEYKRQKNLVKERKADAIESIARPVSGKMPSSTQRKVESITQAKAQKSVLQDLLGRKPGKSDDSDDSDGEVLPYTGTTLHGLMDSPRRKAASLARIRPLVIASRSTAGFQKPKAQSKFFTKSIFESPDPKSAPGQLPRLEYGADATESSDGDDDLDAPIKPPRLTSLDRKNVPVQASLELSRPLAQSSKTKQPSDSSLNSKNIVSFENSNAALGAPSKTVSHPIAFDPPVKVEVSLIVESIHEESDSKARISRRREQYRIQRAKEDREAQEKRPQAVIPTFLG